MNAAAQLRRVHAAAQQVAKPLQYRAISGQVVIDLEAGRVIRTGDYLLRVGGGDLPDGQQSWFGRHVAKAYRAACHGDSVRCWVQHRTTGKWIRVYVYTPADPALATGLRTYKATRHLADQALYARAA